MKRKFVTNLILLLFLNLLIKPVWIFGIDRSVQNLVGDHDYGLYFSLLNFSMLLNILLDLGITSYNNRNIAQHNFLLPKHFSNIVGLKFILAIVYALFSLAAAAVIGYNKIQFHLLFLLIFNQFLLSFIAYLRSNITALHLFRTDSFLSILDRSLLIILCGVLLLNNSLRLSFTIEWFVYAQTVSYALAAIVIFFIVLSHSGKIKIRFNISFSLVFLRKSYPYALLILLMAFYNRIDSVMLERLLPDPYGKEQAGIYAQAFRLLDVASNFAVLFAGMLLPIFSKMIKQKEHVGEMIKLSFSLLIVPALIVAVSSIYYNREIMNLLYESNTAHSSEILGILMIGFIGIATTYIFGTLLTANQSIKQLNLMAFAGMVLNVTLNLILIPRFFAFGSAYASMITQLFTAITQVILVLYIFKLKPDVRIMIQLLVFTGITVVFATISKSFSNWIYGYLFMILASGFAAFLLKLISLKDLYSIIRNEQS